MFKINQSVKWNVELPKDGKQMSQFGSQTISGCLFSDKRFPIIGNVMYADHEYYKHIGVKHLIKFKLPQPGLIFKNNNGNSIEIEMELEILKEELEIFDANVDVTPPSNPTHNYYEPTLDEQT